MGVNLRGVNEVRQGVRQGDRVHRVRQGRIE